MIARQSIIKSVGGFDEDFFLYGEEQDLCLRIRKAGYRIGYVHDAKILHWGGQSERNYPSEEVWKKKFAAEFVFYKKHYSERTIQAIKRANRIQAYWRVLTLNIMLPFLRNKEISLKKLEKYKLILDTFV
jgi:GT2 family glycosyltransferase